MEWEIIDKQSGDVIFRGSEDECNKYLEGYDSVEEMYESVEIRLAGE